MKVEVKKISLKLMLNGLMLFCLGGYLAASASISANAANFVGISNIGNSCYLNAGLQQLYHTDRFRNEILNFKISDESKQKTIFNLQKIFLAMSNCKQECGTVNVAQFIRALGSDVYDGSWKDSHEIITLLINRCDDEHPTKIKHFSNLFNNVSHQEIFCSSCNKKVSECCVRELCLELCPDVSLENMMKNRLSSEKISDYRCPVCNRINDCFMNEQISDFGLTRIVNLGRYKFLNGCMKKVNDRIEFEEVYDFSSERPYILNGVIMHTGGHYYSYVRDHEKNEWYVLNDARALKVGSFDSIKEECFGNGKSSVNATVLFYDKVV